MMADSGTTLVISVLTCTRNPRAGLYQRVVDALAAQTLVGDAWEYVVVDNASTRFPEIDLQGFGRAQVVKEAKPGKIHALLAGLAVCKGEMIVIVDDDNVLAPGYLEVARRIFQGMPFLGAWGGSIVPEFEVQPDPRWARYTNLLTHYDVEKVSWSNSHLSPAPAGAGMCLRREVADRFIQNVEVGGALFEMGRTGAVMPGVDDWEMAMSACDLGLGMGKIPSLKLTHVIPKERVDLGYLLKLQENTAWAYQAYTNIRPELQSIRHCREGRWSRLARWCDELRMDPVERSFCRAFRRGVKRAMLDNAKCRIQEI